MKRLARFAQVACIAGSLATLLGGTASATPFSDVPANHWAYQYIQSLAADGIIDGYPNGKFLGQRPLTRYEMAVVVARAIAKLQENSSGVSKQDLDKLQKLIDSLKDELDSLGVRVANLEDGLADLDKRTKFAQSLSLHGQFLPNVTFRQRYVIPKNTTGVGNAGATPGFFNAFLTTDDSNNPLTQAGSGIQIRADEKFALAYQVNDNLTVTLPVRILNFNYGGDPTQQSRFDILPTFDVTIKRAGAISNLNFRFGILDNMQSSRFGLAFRAPLGDTGRVPYTLSYQPYQKGTSVSGTVGEGLFGSTSFYGSFSRVDDTELNTQTGVLDPQGTQGDINYFFPIVPPQYGYTQVGAAGALRTDTFNSGTSVLTGVFLTQKAVDGSVYVAAFNGATFNAQGVQTGGPATTLPGITYNDANNDVIFSTPLPAGSQVQLAYRGIVATSNSVLQRYMINARLNQKINGLAGAEVGLTYNRVFDFDDTQTSGALTQVFQNSPQQYGLVSDSVFGLDAQVPIPFSILGQGNFPVLFGEVAESKFTADYRNTPALGDTAYVAGGKLKLAKVELNAQYQQIGTDFFVGAPFRYYGNAPAEFGNYKLPYFPDFDGFANNVAINTQYDNSFTSVGQAGVRAANSNTLSFIYPIFNPLKANGPEFFSAFTPNTKGVTVSANAPFRVADLNFTSRFQYAHLQEITPNAGGTANYGQVFTTTVPLKDDTYTANLGFGVPVFNQTAKINLTGAYDQLRRNDATSRLYTPFNVVTGTPDQAATAAQAGLGGTSLVRYFPNYVNMRKITISAAGALPLTNDLALNLSYSTQRFGGAYQTTLGQNISERKDYYTGNFTYAIPKTNSSISFQARNYKYTDETYSQANFSQNRQDVNFTVRF